MHKLTFLLILVFTVTASGGALAQEKSRYSITLEGRLTLAGTPVKDAGQIVFWLTPLDRPLGSIAPAQHFQVTQQNKQFHPNFLVVPQGSTVDFPNLDPWFHNVFSQFRGKRFDLGLYQAGSQRSVVFDKAGVSFLFCNIHPEMTAIIVSVDSKYFAVSDKTGHALITVPPGRYQLHVWHQDALPDSLTAAERVVNIDQDRSVPQITLLAKAQDRNRHKNKYGHDYDPSNLDPQY